MLQEPPSSSYDLHFQLFGYHVRIAWGFWLVAALLGWQSSQGLHQIAVDNDIDSPSAPVLLLLWVAALFLSILVHELGHSIAFSYYGTRSRIVLYHFGGLAIPDSFGAWDGARQRNIGPHEQIVISAAGPVFQLLLAAIVLLAGYFLGVRMQILGFLINPESASSSIVIPAAFDFILYPSVYWALLNLAPILPLDGGHIMQNVLLLTNIQRPYHVALVVSVATGGVLGLYFMMSGNVFGAMMFFMFAANNWQAMQYGDRGF